MNIRCAACGRVVTLVATGVLPAACPHCASRPVPERLGRFVIERLIAAGGMGEVYLARHDEIGTQVAIKLLPPPVGEDTAAMRDRFAREARLQSVVDHPGVVRVLDCDVLGDRPYLVLEYVSGRSLRERLAAGPLPIEEAVRICAEVADVLAAAHGQDVLHRDIKPENVLVADDGHVRVLDFGIARAIDGEAPVTRTGEIVGTPQYMAPEQLLDAGEEVDARCDVHAVGVLAYELLTGQAPFQGANVFAVLKLVESLVPKPPSATRPEVGPELDAVVRRALAKDRTARWPSAAALAAALRATMAGREVDAPVRWGPWQVVMIALVITAGALLGGWAGSWLSAKPPESDAQAQVQNGVDREAIAALLTPAVLSRQDEERLRDAVIQLSRSEDSSERRLRGRVRMRIGAYHAAVFDLAGLGAEARDDARMAWLCAHVLLPLCVDAPRYWSRCDDTRRDLLFGRVPDRDLEGTDVDASILLAHDRPAAAWLRLQPELQKPVEQRAPHAATLALLAAHLACDDRRVVRQLARQPDAAPDVVELLDIRMLPSTAATERQRMLRARAAQLPADGPDRWLYEILAAGLDDSLASDRLPALAELAWLHGAGEAAAVWFVGARLRQARGQGEVLAADEVARHRKLLATTAPAEAPAVAVQELLLDAQAGAAIAPERLAPELRQALPPSLAFVSGWFAVGAELVGPVNGRPRARGAALVDLLRRAAQGRPDHVALLFFDVPAVHDAIAAALAAVGSDASDETFFLLALALRAGLEPAPDQQPWPMLTMGAWRQRWLQEVCRGVQ